MWVGLVFMCVSVLQRVEGDMVVGAAAAAESAGSCGKCVDCCGGGNVNRDNNFS